MSVPGSSDTPRANDLGGGTAASGTAVVSALVAKIRAEMRPKWRVTPGGLKWSPGNDALRDLAALAGPDKRDESVPHASGVAGRLGPNREGLRSPFPGESSKPGPASTAGNDATALPPTLEASE